MVKQSEREESVNGILYDDLQHKVKTSRFVDGCWQ